MGGKRDFCLALGCHLSPRENSLVNSSESTRQRPAWTIIGVDDRLRRLGTSRSSQMRSTVRRVPSQVTQPTHPGPLRLLFFFSLGRWRASGSIHQRPEHSPILVWPWPWPLLFIPDPGSLQSCTAGGPTSGHAPHHAASPTRRARAAFLPAHPLRGVWSGWALS